MRPTPLLHRLSAAALAGVAAFIVSVSAVAAPPPPRVVPIQKLEPSTGPQESVDTEHFRLTYSPDRMDEADAKRAGELAEQGYAHCEKLFGPYPGLGKIRMDLSPNFLGATGFTTPGNPKDPKEEDRPHIGVRYADLAYLGISGDYVLTHEIAHAFTIDIAGTALGEGIADWAAGRFSEVPMRPWWGKALREAGLWVEPNPFFITGEFPSNPEVNAVIRTAQYAESGLLIQYLVDRFGWDKFKAFAGEYGEARGRLNSNEDRARMRVRQRRNPQQRDPRMPPDANAVRALFPKHFGESWDEIRAGWEKRMEADRAPAGQEQRLVIGHRIYGAVRNYEMWLIDQHTPPSRTAQALVRQAFTEANLDRIKGDFPAADAALGRAMRMVSALRNPQNTA